MKILYLLIIINIGLTLTSCTTTCYRSNQAHKMIACNSSPTKNPIRVAFYTKQLPSLPYSVLGKESIPKYKGGNKRQEAHIRDSMREIAAAMGGDAVIDIKHDDRSITGTVIAYQKENETEKKVSS